eukprot:CAMPEP_0184308770 /NCGR_PEP_ID=MMETSP1049-20130417/17128_1 /TAXON_ID=77928 /ORGANISM="Proteomonas sulcata, Strain CCMP704" /LENGTH=177 /DNA_ID=CAMNT_0026621517 /DNA_START=365 /DNA_END=898 /DNA_ORIENTATION=+
MYTVDHNVKVVLWPEGDRPLLPTVGRSGMTVEVGPVAHSTVNSALLHSTKVLVLAALDFVQKHNTIVESGTALESPGRRQVPVFKGVGKIDYPRSENGDILGFIHPNLQGLLELSKTISVGDALFQMIDGSTLTFKGDEKGLEAIQDLPSEISLYPFFVNEAAYYEQGVALAFCVRV